MTETPLTREQVKSLGFIEPPFEDLIRNSLLYHLPRRRFLSIGNIGDPNEMIFLGQRSDKDNTTVDDSICIHNWDYDGYMTMPSLKAMLDVFHVES